MAGKDTRFKKQYTIYLKGISKLDKGFGDTQTFQENYFESMLKIYIEVYNSQHKTSKATLKIKKIK